MSGRELLLAGLVLACVLTNVLSIVAFKQSGLANATRNFLWYQALGNLWGFASVLAFTFLARYWPLKMAYPITVGLTVLVVQLAVARLVFQETVTPVQLAGGALIVTGIVFVASNR